MSHFYKEYPVRLMCRCLRVSPSGFYAWRRRSDCTRRRDNRRLLAKIRDLHARSEGVLGSGRIHARLREEGEACSQNRIARLMRLDGLRGIPARRRWALKPTGERPEDVENHINRDFTAEVPNTKWVIDITYIRTAEGWLYLAAVRDLCDATIVGWSTDRKQDTKLVLEAVQSAIWQRSSGTHTILHSDRGCQFTSKQYQDFLKENSLTSSMSAVGSCADNAPAESFFGILKRERVNRRSYATRTEARSDLFDYIERFYNPARRRKISGPKLDKTSLTQLSTETG